MQDQRRPVSLVVFSNGELLVQAARLRGSDEERLEVLVLEEPHFACQSRALGSSASRPKSNRDRVKRHDHRAGRRA